MDLVLIIPFSLLTRQWKSFFVSIRRLMDRKEIGREGHTSHVIASMEFLGLQISIHTIFKFPAKLILDLSPNSLSL